METIGETKNKFQPTDDEKRKYRMRGMWHNTKIENIEWRFIVLNVIVS